MSLIFAILSVAVGTLGTILGGIIGMFITLILAVLTIIFSVMQKKENGKVGMGRIITASIAMLISLLITVVFLGSAGYIKMEAKNCGASVVEENVSYLKYGAIGFSIRLDKENVDIDEFEKEVDIIINSLGESEPVNTP